ncbi:MAG TPA: hypothetical protein VD713_07210, partial [Sphingomonadales bacterium]|nr:hypothetical protein [Sphingomonadales bacterium]
MTQFEPLKPDISLEELTAKAKGGHTLAQYALAKVEAARGENRKAAEWLGKAAEGQFAPVVYELGMWHLLGHHVDFDVKRARALITAAADKKFSDALRLRAVLEATGVFPGGTWETAVDHLLVAADMADPHSLRQIGFLLRTQGGEAKLSEKMLKSAASLNEPISRKLVGEQKGVIAEKEIPENWDAWPGVREFLLTLGGEAVREGET